MSALEISGKGVAEARLWAAKRLAVREHTETELRRKLKKRGFADPVVSVVLDDLKARGALDEDRFAREFIRSRMMRRPCGRSLLAAELRKRGVAEAAAGTALDEALGEEEEWKAACGLAEKKAAVLLRYPDDQRRRKVFLFLRSRGFPRGMILKVLHELSGGNKL